MQVPINVELPNDVRLQLNELLSGDVEIVLQSERFWHSHGWPWKPTSFIIPQNRRCVIAHWLVGGKIDDLS